MRKFVPEFKIYTFFVAQFFDRPQHLMFVLSHLVAFLLYALFFFLITNNKIFFESQTTKMMKNVEKKIAVKKKRLFKHNL